MLRFLYRCLLRLHPQYFRRRFSQEMLSIFDQQKGTWAAAKLVADGVQSLLRQWLLRPEFWDEPAAPPDPERVPGFHVIERFTPHTSVLFDGALASVVVFTATCMIMGYVWNHPTSMPPISVYRSGSNISWAPAPSRSHPQTPVQPVFVDGDRLILIIRNPSQSTASRQRK
jgi:hypothetical protein